MSAAHPTNDDYDYDDDLPPIDFDETLDGPAALVTEQHSTSTPLGTPLGTPTGRSNGKPSLTASDSLDDFDADGDHWDHDEHWDNDVDHRAPDEPLSAAGVVVLRSTDAGPRIAVLESGGVVSLPKAEVGPGESSETAASRAAEAFTGHRVRLVESLGQSLERVDGSNVAAWFWLARTTRAAGFDVHASPPAGFTLHWLDIEEAAHAMTSDGERHLLERLRTQPLPSRRRPFASASRRVLIHDLEAFRDDSVALARGVDSPEQLEALMRAREEIERAEDRLARGDEAGARRARARAERETLVSLDPEGRAIALRRALERAPEHLRGALSAAVPSPGMPVSLDVLLAVQSAVDSGIEDDARAADARRAAQVHATAALAVSTLAILGAAWYGLFREAPRPVLGTVAAAVVFVVSGQLGGWVGEALFALRERNPARHLSLPLAAATGGLAGLTVGAVLSNGLGGFIVENAALTIAATFVAGWVARMVLPRGG